MKQLFLLASLIFSSSALAFVNNATTKAIKESDWQAVIAALETDHLTQETKSYYLHLAHRMVEQRKSELTNNLYKEDKTQLSLILGSITACILAGHTAGCLFSQYEKGKISLSTKLISNVILGFAAGAITRILLDKAFLRKDLLSARYVCAIYIAELLNDTEITATLCPLMPA